MGTPKTVKRFDTLDAGSWMTTKFTRTTEGFLTGRAIVTSIGVFTYQYADGTVIRGKCSFGELDLIVPRTCRVDPHVSTTLGALETKGNPDPNAPVTIRLEGGVSFGQIEVRYV